MNKKLLIIIILSIFSCKRNDFESQLINIYKEKAQLNQDTLEIENVEVLNYSSVDFDYVKNIQINNIKYTIDLNNRVINNNRDIVDLINRNIENRRKIIELNPKEKEKYLAQIEISQNNLKKTNKDIKRLENQNAIAQQKIVLIKAELGSDNETSFDLIKYVFNGTINGQKIIDTLSLLQSKDYKPKFLKKNRFSDYTGN